MGEIETIRHDGVDIAFERQVGATPTFVWLSGFKSDMAGTKAQRLAEWAEARGQAFVRLDYSGHGKSGGVFEDGTISRWLSDALAVIDAKTWGPLVLVGSSMGGWIALLAARARPERVKGLLLIAPAADFTEKLMRPNLTEEALEAIESEGQWSMPSAYSDDPTIITDAMLEDGRNHLLMDEPYPFAGPIRILQGEEDPDVPASHALALANILRTDDLVIDMVRDGDHRLSRPEDLDRLVQTADRLAEQLAH
ncbi:2-hydroxymuconic semialdehyde hydrolase [alpha proteobacterium U9-1i]|nr:2-hydroxymuconic semialdehyde hydrolase [alpha proteobacterium U9-1i]